MPKLSRRDLLRTTALAGVASLFQQRLLAKAPQPSTKVSFAVPPGSCDCHVHVFGDPQKYPFFAGRVYTPEPATIAELESSLKALGLQRTVVVQPSVYGTDNRCTLDALKALGPRGRGVAVVDAKTTDASLDEMGRAGVRGLRVNLSTAGINDPATALKGLQAAADRARTRNWHLQINTSMAVINALRTQLAELPVTLVIDHFGGATGAGGLQQPGFDALVGLVKSGKAYVKISGAADSVSTQAPGYADAAPLARALVAANPQRILWGSNWPHPDSRVLPDRKNTDIAPLVQIDDGLVLNLLPTWVPDEAVRRAILVDNPARLYGF